MEYDEIVDMSQWDDEKLEREIRQEVKVRLSGSDYLEDDSISAVIRGVICEYGQKISLPISRRKQIERRIFNSFRRLGVLQDFLDDSEVTEVMVNGYNRIYVERKGEMILTGEAFSSPQEYEDLIQKIVARRNKIVNETVPIVDTRLDDGSRINIVLSPVAIHGSVMTIRKFPEDAISMADLIDLGSIGKKEAEFLRDLVESKYNIFISGGTSSGKTTFLGALTEFVGDSERVICIEDSAEIQFQKGLNLVRLESRDKNIEGKNEITIRELVKTSLRMRPDRLIVGECRGPETFEMLQAMNTGHDGCFSTGHANSSQDMISRLESMALMAERLPIEVVRSLIVSGIDIIVHLERGRDGRRRMKEICEMDSMKDDEVKVRKIVEFDEESGAWVWKRGLKDTLKKSYLKGNYA